MSEIDEHMNTVGRKLKDAAAGCGLSIDKIALEPMVGSESVNSDIVARVDNRSAVLAIALAEAAIAARAQGERIAPGDDIRLAKESVDGAATSAGERILRSTQESIVIRAGEGERDESPGAVLDQSFGSIEPLEKGASSSVEAVIDYVDGTGLVAKGLPNALALGALGEGLARIPDLKTFAVLAPSKILDLIDDWSSPRDVARAVLDALATYKGVRPSELTVLTHSRDVGRPQDPWYDQLGEFEEKLIIPDPISVEPPYILSRFLPLSPKIDCMIGVMGLVELVYAAMLLDLAEAPDTFNFRLVGNTSSKNLLGSNGPAFVLSEAERIRATGARFSAQVVHDSVSLVPKGAASMAAMFAVTRNQILNLPSATPKSVSGIIMLPGRICLRVDIERGEI